MTPMTEPERRGYSLKALFLLVTLSAVFASLLNSGIQRYRGARTLSRPTVPVAIGVAIVSLVVGSAIGGVGGLRRPPRVQNALLGALTGIVSGGAAAAIIVFPPRWQALLPACLVLLIMGGITRWTAR